MKYLVGCCLLLICQVSVAGNKQIHNVDDCQDILSAIPVENPIEEMRREVIAHIRDAPIGGNEADLHLPIVRHTEALGVTADGSLVHVPFRALYTERFMGKYDRDVTYLVSYDVDAQSTKVIRPDSHIDSNGSVSSSIYQRLVPVLTRLQVKALEQAEIEVPEIESPYIAGMDSYDLGPGTPDILRITVGSLKKEIKQTKSYLVRVDFNEKDRSVRFADYLLSERTTNLPAQPEKLEKRKEAERLVLDQRKTLKENFKRAALTKINDEEIHHGDDVPQVELIGQFKGKLGDKIGVIQASIILYNNNPLSLYYTVVIQSDGRMVVQRDIRFDEEGDKADDSLFVAKEAEKNGHKLNLEKKLLPPNEDWGKSSPLRAIGYVRTLNPTIEFEPNRYYVLLTGTYSSAKNERNAEGRLPEVKREFVGAIEMSGGMPIPTTPTVLVGSKIIQGN